mgnify:CR=1 FL=1
MLVDIKLEMSSEAAEITQLVIASIDKPANLIGLLTETELCPDEYITFWWEYSGPPDGIEKITILEDNKKYARVSRGNNGKTEVEYFDQD